MHIKEVNMSIQHQETEAQARIKINKLLEKAGWRFIASQDGSANKDLKGAIPGET